MCRCDKRPVFSSVDNRTERLLLKLLKFGDQDDLNACGWISSRPGAGNGVGASCGDIGDGSGVISGSGGIV